MSDSKNICLVILIVLLSFSIPASIPADCHHDDRPSVYVGFDPTADSLHTGNLVTIIALLHFQRAGYQPLAVVSTTKQRDQK